MKVIDNYALRLPNSKRDEFYSFSLNSFVSLSNATIFPFSGIATVMSTFLKVLRGIDCTVRKVRANRVFDIVQNPNPYPYRTVDGVSYNADNIGIYLRLITFDDYLHQHANPCVQISLTSLPYSLLGETVEFNDYIYPIDLAFIPLKKRAYMFEFNKIVDCISRLNDSCHAQLAFDFL